MQRASRRPHGRRQHCCCEHHRSQRRWCGPSAPGGSQSRGGGGYGRGVRQTLGTDSIGGFEGPGHTAPDTGFELGLTTERYMGLNCSSIIHVLNACTLGKQASRTLLIRCPRTTPDRWRRSWTRDQLVRSIFQRRPSGTAVGPQRPLVFDVRVAGRSMSVMPAWVESLSYGPRKVIRTSLDGGVALSGAEIDDLAVIFIHHALHSVEDRFQNTVDIGSIAVSHHRREVVNAHADTSGDRIARRRRRLLASAFTAARHSSSRRRLTEFLGFADGGLPTTTKSIPGIRVFTQPKPQRRRMSGHAWRRRYMHEREV